MFTEADVHIQNTVIYNLKQLYPRATIIGEEDEVADKIKKKAPYVEPDQLDVNHVSRELLLNNYVRQQKNGYRRYLKDMEQIYGVATPQQERD